MDLRPAEYEEFTKFIKARVHFSSTQAVINAAINVVEAFQALHRKGLSYQDLSPGNFFINKDTGAVLICDKMCIRDRIRRARPKKAMVRAREI